MVGSILGFVLYRTRMVVGPISTTRRTSCHRAQRHSAPGVLYTWRFLGVWHLRPYLWPLLAPPPPLTHRPLRGRGRPGDAVYARAVGGHGDESFVVNNRRFTYSSAMGTGGFNQTHIFRGPIREGIYVRIAHVGNVILRLEVAKENNANAP